MSVVPLSPRSRWVTDPRGAGRGVRISTHPEAGVLVLSVWKADVCVATTRLPPHEAAELVAALAESLAELAADPVGPQAPAGHGGRQRTVQPAGTQRTAQHGGPQGTAQHGGPQGTAQHGGPQRTVQPGGPQRTARPTAGTGPSLPDVC